MAVEMDPSAWERIRGLAFRRDGETVMTDPQPFIEDLDTLPSSGTASPPDVTVSGPRRSDQHHHESWLSLFLHLLPGATDGGQSVRLRSASRVVDEIEQILAYGIDRINVADDLFVSHGGRVKEVCGEILRRGLRFNWSAFARVNTVDRETLKLMKEAGCDSVSFGVEQRKSRPAQADPKKITREQVREAVSIFKETGIIANISLSSSVCPGRVPRL